MSDGVLGAKYAGQSVGDYTRIKITKKYTQMVTVYSKK
jgi:hypothetical protein